MIKFRRLEDIPIIWDKFLKPNECRLGPTGWHVGVGTDLHELVFEANLTGADRRFLKSLKIGAGDAIRGAT